MLTKTNPMKKFYPSLIFFLSFLLVAMPDAVWAQPCSGLQFTSVGLESRCTSTGSIVVTASGGSGNYNYKAVGPLTTPFTSSSTITGLRPGFYQVVVKDVVSGCETARDSVEVTGTYSDPRFGLNKTNVSCLGNDGTITANSLQFGRNPFTYSIIAPSPAGVGLTNKTGAFVNLVAGEYYIQLRDSCGGIQVRRATVEAYSWWFESVTVTKVGCDSASALIVLKDNKGNASNSGTSFNEFLYGVVRAAGDTSWYPTGSFRFFLGKRRSVTIIAKDACGIIHTSIWNVPPSLIPSGGSVNIGSYACNLFSANIAGTQNLTAPQYCLYNNTNTLVKCNSTGIFDNLAYGSYCIQIRDACYDTTITRCFSAARRPPAIGTVVAISAQTCASFTASIQGQTNLTTPTYCLYNNANSLISCNNTGVFPNLRYGSYCIKTQDQCTDTIITRCFTAARPVPVLNTPAISGSTCGTFNVTGSGTGLNNPLFCIYNSAGVLIRCDSTGTFTGLPHGSYCMRAISCGDTTASRCFSSGPPVPSVAAAVQISNRTCTSFSAAITGGVNLTAPRYCLFDSRNVQVSCNNTGIFSNLNYGSYCIQVKDSCTDSTIVRCFTAARAIPTINSTIEQSNSTCSTFTARVTGTNLTAPQYCLYNSRNQLVRCNTTGIFDSLPYDRYCVNVDDACGESFRICQRFAPLGGITLSSSKSCSVGKANINVQFLNGSSPYTVTITHPNGSTAFTQTTTSNPVTALLPALPSGLSYKILGRDACGRFDTASIIPDATLVTKSITAVSKCPSSMWANGSGDLSVNTTTNLYTFRPGIIKKNGSSFTRSYSSNSGNNYLFNDLEPATYIIEYTLASCNVKMYDTFALQPYRYPTQGQSAIYQCDNSNFSLGADVSGGASPYAYQIIGSMPDTPGIATPLQTSPIFNINNGTKYSLVRLRTIDGCGNATLSDLSVLPLQNMSITASRQCYYDEVTLSVQPVANATYEWYKKREARDSTLVGTEASYTIPFFEQEHTATYVNKVTVNNGCLKRLSTFNLVENCDRVVLPGTISLTGKKEAHLNQLRWTVADERDIEIYSIELRTANAAAYKVLGNRQSTKATLGSDYTFTHPNPDAGNNLYRLKILYKNGKVSYSNIIRLTNEAAKNIVFPNPANDVVSISIRGEQLSDYDVYVMSTGGQVLYETHLKGILYTTLPYKRKNLPPGLYLIRIKNNTTGVSEYHKVIFR